MNEYKDCPPEYDADYRLGYESAIAGDEMNDDYRPDNPDHNSLYWERTGFFDGYKEYLKENNNVN